MKEFKEDFKKIYSDERGMFVLIILNFLLAVGLVVYTIINLNPDSAVIKIGYGDIGGYLDGAWTNMLMYPLLAVLFGVLHSLLSLRIFHKKSTAMAKFFLLTTTLLILGTFVVLVRILKEG